MYAFRAARPLVSLTRTTRVGEPLPTRTTLRVVVEPPARVPASDVERFHEGVLRDLDAVLHDAADAALRGSPAVFVRVVLDVEYSRDPPGPEKQPLEQRERNHD
jgi:hypothetical protein